ncbi:hypothetical protein BDY21DRAFT_63672 [Lineolata rhizophorae]|uniref:C2H2-type domain-containing protein n=1 Tax=Lineolata rhizophorae TaxID=578093 RepID=A0A6A6NVV4_9PEZI|nr:hypothetical protein BDY21DRAFT_63672 [Lineolata rhizophorae]
MTASKDMTTSTRPTTSGQHRLSTSSGSAANSLPSSRQSRTHSHSHSVSAGSANNQAHRVSRRKSMSSTATPSASSVAAISAALDGSSGGRLSSSGAGSSSKRTSKGTLGPPRGPQDFASSLASSLPNNNGSGFGGASSEFGAKNNGSAISDGPPLSAMSAGGKAGSSKARARRASEGSRLTKGESKRQSNGELRCEKCGKGYKHSSCLTKHLWEHTPEWAYTSKLLISKHQQVQLLEAASVLVAMNQEASSSGAAPMESAKNADSDGHSSASPTASGFSGELRDDDLSSNDTTPPPQIEGGRAFANGAQHYSKRFSNATSSAYSRSYQSVFSDSAPNALSPQHFRQWSADTSVTGGDAGVRPTTSSSISGSTAYDDGDSADLAAAVGLLSCSYGTPKTGPSMLPPDVPPVPPLPARYLGQSVGARKLSGSELTPNVATTIGQHVQSVERETVKDEFAAASQPMGRAAVYAGGNKDVNMRDDYESFADEEEFGRHDGRDRMDEDEDGVFGTMEE